LTWLLILGDPAISPWRAVDAVQQWGAAGLFSGSVSAANSIRFHFHGKSKVAKQIANQLELGIGCELLQRLLLRSFGQQEKLPSAARCRY